MPLAVLLYYFFRKKYKDQRVSSTLFWREMMKEIRASPYLKKLQHHALLYLQLAALLICVFALLGPQFNSETLEGNEFIFVMDTSASMLAGDPGGFEQQQALMKSLAGQTGGKPVTIVTTGASPKIIVRKEREKQEIEKAIEQLAVTYENAEIEQTLLFAETLVEDKSTVIHVFTDVLARSLLANKIGVVYEVHGIEQNLKNVSMRQFGLSETEDGMRAVVQLVNDSTEAVAGKVTISGEAAEKSADVEIEAGETVLVPFEQLPDAPIWQAVLDVEDDYSQDNTMAAFAKQAAAGVAVDSSLHELVGSGFQSLNVEVNLMQPEQLVQAEMPIATNQTDMLNADVPVLLIGRDDEKPHAVEGDIETTSHALFTYAPLDDIYVAELYPPFENYETIATISGEPFIQLSPKGDIAVLTDIQSTDWPLSPSFPLFLWSAVAELAGSDNFLGFFQPNEQRAVALASPSGEWEIYQDGEYLQSYLEGQGPFTAPQKPGIYNVVGDGRTMKMIVQLSNEEKVLSSGTSFQLGKAEASAETVKFSIVPWLILAMLVFVLAEWEVYRRGIAHR